MATEKGREGEKGKEPELKIRGQAEAERRKGKWDEEDRKIVRLTYRLAAAIDSSLKR